MRCEEFESRINELLDERHPPHADERVADHVRECDACADVLAGYQQALDVVRGGAPVERDTNPTAEIVAKVQLAARRGRRLWTTLVPLAVAASLLIALAPLIEMRFDRRDVQVAGGSKSESDTPSVAPPKVVPVVTDSQRPVPLPDDPQGAEIVLMAFELNEALADLRDRLSKTLAEEKSPPPAAGVDDVANDGPEGRKWFRNMSDVVKPLTDTMAAALSAMGRTLPSAGGQEPPSS